MKYPILWLMISLILLAGCAPPPLPFGAAPTTTPPPLAAAAGLASPTLRPKPTVRPSPTLRPTDAPTPSATPVPTARPGPTSKPLRPTPTLAPLEQGQRQALFDEVWELVRDNYLYTDFRGLDWNKVRTDYRPRALAATNPDAFYAVLQDMIDALGDDHSRFETPQDVAAEEAQFEGDLSYAGIGARMRDVDEGGFITELAPAGPAEQAGLRPGDIVLAVAGIPFTDTNSFGPAGPIGAVRGEPGTTVVLSVRSPGTAPRDVSVTRQIISGDAYPQVAAERLPGNGVILLKINTFYLDNLNGLVQQTLESALADGKPVDGLIIDVRDNGGGRIDLLLDTLALFINGGSIGTASARDYNDPLTIPAGQTIPAMDGVPIVVLTSEETVSAAEMFSAGMQALGRAKVVGIHTAGNTENLNGHDFDDGSRLWLAELAYRMPNGKLIEGAGVQPDRVVEAEWWRFAPADDPQVKAAIEIFQWSKQT